MSSRAAPMATKRSNSRRLLWSVARAPAVAAWASPVSKIATLRAASRRARRPRVGAHGARPRHKGPRPQPRRGHVRAPSVSATRHQHQVVPPPGKSPRRIWPAIKGTGAGI
jgi:hypothetical protein